MCFHQFNFVLQQLPMHRAFCNRIHTKSINVRSIYMVLLVVNMVMVLITVVVLMVDMVVDMVVNMVVDERG